MQGQCVHRTCQLLCQCTINQLMSRYLALPLESWADRNNLKMSFRIGRHIVLMTLVNNRQVGRRQKLPQALFYLLQYGHNYLENLRRDYN